MSILAFVRLARPRHWVKNLFVAAPLFFTPAALSWTTTGRVALAVAVFCVLSSAVYVINDWCDREADRQHPEKRLRPLASGEVGAVAGLAFAAALFAAAAAGAAFLPPGFVAFAAAYFAINLLYSFGLKNVAILDVLIIAIGFVLRVEAGSAAIGVTASVWIVVSTGLLALFLALAKRRDDVVKTMSTGHRRSLGGYDVRFIDTALAMVLGALLVSYIIYTTDQSVIARYGTDKLYVTAPFVVAGALRYLQIALVEERSGSPTDVMLTDRFLILAVLGWVATFGAILYG